MKISYMGVIPTSVHTSLILLYSSLNLSVDDDDDDIIAAADDLIDLAPYSRRCPLCFCLND